jgi:hypothetical protein
VRDRECVFRVFQLPVGRQFRPPVVGRSFALICRSSNFLVVDTYLAGSRCGKEEKADRYVRASKQVLSQHMLASA